MWLVSALLRAISACIFKIQVGPRSPNEALRWIKGAFRENHFRETTHFRDERSRQRNVDILDVKEAVRRATGVEPYTNNPAQHGGTCWRVLGPDADGERVLGIGVEAYRDEDGKWVVLCTVIEVQE